MSLTLKESKTNPTPKSWQDWDYKSTSYIRVPAPVTWLWLTPADTRSDNWICTAKDLPQDLKRRHLLKTAPKSTEERQKPRNKCVLSSFLPPISWLTSFTLLACLLTSALDESETVRSKLLFQGGGFEEICYKSANVYIFCYRCRSCEFINSTCTISEAHHTIFPWSTVPNLWRGGVGWGWG